MKKDTVQLITDREKEILQLVAKGLTSHTIAQNLFISLKTVENHRCNLLKKLEAKNTAGMMVRALSEKLI